MKLTHDIYPIFEANQVLSDLHLNEIFNYLDEQDRLTRANLIGIGIVCGLEISFDQSTAPTIRLTKGYGVTSEGYLVLEPQDVALVSYRKYALPDEPGYPSLKDPSSATGEQFDLWELFPAGEPDTTPFGTPADFLKDKAVLLFLELKKEGLRNCSPNNCDDKGAKITATVRRLLIWVDDLAQLIAAANKLEGKLTLADLGTTLSARLNLPDLRLPRYDVPSTGPATSRDVLAAFLAVFQTGQLAKQTGNALTAAYDAFKPLVGKVDSPNPFADFAVKFGFLDSMPKTAAQVRFLPYYYDWFDDLLKAYDEFRWKGVELLCACCPSESLFPRHLMLGALFSNAVSEPGLYRHGFLRSPAVGDCQERTNDLLVLFKRLVEMIARFSDAPQLPEKPSQRVPDPQIRITPSKAGDVALSEKAIPYYYDQGGNPPLYHLWNTEKLRRKRAHHNLGYRSDEYVPPAPLFVTDPLRYDLEPYDFLRIEGHLGKEYQHVLNTLLSVKARYRLPIEIVALRASVFDERVPVDLSKEECRFQDLEALYDTLREELRCFLAKELTFFYDLPVREGDVSDTAVRSIVPVLIKYRPDFLVKSDRLGALFESQYKRQVFSDELLGLVSTTLNTAFFRIIFHIVKLDEILTENLGDVNFDNLANRHRELEESVRELEIKREERFSQLEGAANILRAEEIDDRLEAILFNCRLDAFKSIRIEYQRRIREVKQKQFLSFFLQKNPGIQHKAGVPVGGTFILIYHDEPSSLKGNLGLDVLKIDVSAAREISRKALVAQDTISAVLSRMRKKRDYADDPEVKELFGVLTGQVPDFIKTADPGAPADKIIDAALGELANGTVIADFFLPYLCCSGRPSVQFVLPKTPPTFTVQMACTSPNNQAEVTVAPKGGEGPYSYKLGDADIFLPLTGALMLPVGTHTLVIQDSAGTESAPRLLTVPAPLTIEKETYIDNVAAKTYQVSVPISGGTAPYTAETGTVVGSAFTSLSMTSGEAATVNITDSAGCKVSREFRHTICDLPCGGVSHRCGFRFWLPEPEPNRPYREYSGKVPVFTFEFPQGVNLDLARDVEQAIQARAENLTQDFNGVVQSWVKHINTLIARATQRKDWLRLSYEKTAADAIGTLWIEYFECLKFEFQIAASFQRPEVQETMTVNYSPGGTTAAIGRAKVKIPPFNCVQINKCDPEQLEIPRCGKINLALRIVKTVDGTSLTLDVEPTGDDSPTAFLWEVQDGIPPVSMKKKDQFTLSTTAPGIKTIRVTTYTEKGCAVTKVDTIEIPNR